ncbi:hypothetical protein Golob_022608 [Gossypium lobatum]|uniref:Uncharacterized protein n=1 Tax=Gossypium lobatum TaxID=34289 RepID=A0A7J8LH59_9ROSI|nr:hypothetical protein [Gossypium lobatum]
MKCLTRHLKNWVSLLKNCESNLKAGNPFRVKFTFIACRKLSM